jgi:hypothetical protein
MIVVVIDHRESTTRREDVMVKRVTHGSRHAGTWNPAEPQWH